MGIYRMIKKEFDFLSTVYGFEIEGGQKYGSYYYITWKKTKIAIHVLYDLQEENRARIDIYDEDAPGTICDMTTYQDELITTARKDRDKIHYAAEWFKRAIENKTIVIDSVSG